MARNKKKQKLRNGISKRTSGNQCGYQNLHSPSTFSSNTITAEFSIGVQAKKNQPVSPSSMKISSQSCSTLACHNHEQSGMISRQDLVDAKIASDEDIDALERRFGGIWI